LSSSVFWRHLSDKGGFCCRASADQNKQIVLKEIGAKWDRFSEQALSALKVKADLVAHVVAKYGLEMAQA